MAAFESGVFARVSEGQQLDSDGGGIKSLFFCTYCSWRGGVGRGGLRTNLCPTLFARARARLAEKGSKGVRAPWLAPPGSLFFFFFYTHTRAAPPRSGRARATTYRSREPAAPSEAAQPRKLTTSSASGSRLCASTPEPLSTFTPKNKRCIIGEDKLGRGRATQKKNQEPFLYKSSSIAIAMRSKRSRLQEISQSSCGA